MITKESRITKIQKSWKKEGYVFVGTVGRQDDGHLRKVYTYKYKPGLGFINLDTDIFSFNWDGQNGTNITYVGNYKSVDEAVKEKTIEVLDKEIKPAAVIDTDDSGEVRHEKFETIKTCIQNDVPVFLVGPAGSGKNHTLEQIAWDLGLEFHFTNSIQQEYKLTGFIDAGGNYHETEFYKACKEGEEGKQTLFFLDEMDASIPEVLVLLNMAIANGYFEFPNGKLSFGKNVKFVAAGNTVGNGADEQYTGRLQLDQATLDRFAIIEFDYSMKIETYLAKGNIDLVTFVRELRDQAKQKGIRTTLSYRCITMVTKLEGTLELTEVLKIAILKGLDKDTINNFRPEGHSKYHMALRKVQA